MYISTKARARKHGCSLWQILMCSLFSCCCLQQKCLELYIFEVDKLLLFAKGKKLSKQISKLYQKIISKGSFSSNHSTAVSYETISTNTLNRQNNSSFYDLVLLLVWFLVEKSMDQIYLKSRISVWTTYTEIVVALLCEKDLTRLYYIQILFYGNDVSSQENNGTNSILLVHSSEKSCLWLMKFFLKTLQNLRYFWNTKSHVLLYFFISCCINISPDECLLF